MIKSESTNCIIPKASSSITVWFGRRHLDVGGLVYFVSTQRSLFWHGFFVWISKFLKTITLILETVTEEMSSVCCDLRGGRDNDNIECTAMFCLHYFVGKVRKSPHLMHATQQYKETHLDVSIYEYRVNHMYFCLQSLIICPLRFGFLPIALRLF